MINHQQNLQEAIKLSNVSVDSGSSPFGCIIVNADGVEVGRGFNHVVLDNDPTAHGEVMAIRDACRNLGTFDLSGCILYTSCEPCPMCLNACKWANIAEVYYAADRYDAEGIGFRDRFFYENEVLKLYKIAIPEAVEVMTKWKNKREKVEY